MLRDWDEVFGVSNARASRYFDFDHMDSGVVASMLDAITRSALRFDGNEAYSDTLGENDCFKVHIEGYGTSGPRQVIEQIIEDTDLRGELRAITRDVLRNGDEFIEVQVDGTNIVGIVPYRVDQMVVRRDIKGRLEAGEDKDGPLAYRQYDSGRLAGAWFPHEMLHLKYMPSRKFSYSIKGFLDDYRAIYKKISWIEESMVIGRTSRSFPRLIHYVDVTNKSAQDAKKILSDYIRAFTRRILPSGASEKVPLTPDEDIFIATGMTAGPDGKPIAKLNRVEHIDPNVNGLANIQDVKMFRQQLFDRVPAAMLGVQEQNATTELTDQELAFGDLLGDLQRILECQLIRKLFDYGLKLKGYYGKVRYDITWPQSVGSPSWKLADAQFRLSLKARSEIEFKGMSRKFYLKRTYGMTDEQATDLLVEAEAEEKRFGPLKPGDTTGLIAKGSQSAGLDPVQDYINEITKNT